MAGSSPKVIIGGDVKNSQIVIGDHNNVYVSQPNQPPKVERIPSPVFLGRPRRPVDLLDREQERDIAQKALPSGSPAEFYAEEGFGKTTLLSYLASQLQLPDGTLYLSVSGKPLDDLLQELFTAFYQSDQVYKPSQVEYLRRFAGIRALIVLDDLTLTREETQTLLNDLPACVFLLSSSEQHLWGQGEHVRLGGLPPGMAVDLFQQELGRSLSDAERSAVQKVCEALQDNPLHILQAAGAVRDEGKSISDLAGALGAQPAEKTLYDQLTSALPDPKKRVLALLATLNGAALPAEHLAKVLKVQNFPELLESLLKQNLVQAHSPRYSLTNDFAVYLRQTWDISEWKDALLKYFMDWTAGSVSRDRILDSADALFEVLGNAAAEEHWQEVLKIGRAIEPAFILSGQWGMWARLLNLLAQAGQILGDRFTQAWVLHQLGSRALCLGNSSGAKELLSRALDIRKAIGDRAGLTATQHNLQQLQGGPGPGGCRRWLKMRRDRSRQPGGPGGCFDRRSQVGAGHFSATNLYSHSDAHSYIDRNCY